MSRTAATLAMASALLALAPGALAQVDVSFPLHGYYRPGRYMPVRLSADPGAGDRALTVRATGTVPTSLPAPAQPAYAPWLAVGTAVREPRWSLSGGPEGTIDAPLRALGDDEALVGVCGGEHGAIAQSLFADRTVITVPLDAAQPLPGPAVAWEALDGLLLDETGVRSLTEGQLATVLAAGTTVAVRRVRKPNEQWPWRRFGDDYWIIAHQPPGPSGAVSAEAYEPTYGWSPGWPTAERRWTVLLAVVFCILLAALSLWRSRRAAAAAVVFSLACGAGLAGWHSARSPLAAAAGSVVVSTDGGGLVQTDRWTYFQSLSPADVSLPWRPSMRPVFASHHHHRQHSDLRLTCTAAGQPSAFTWRMEPTRTIAFVSRTVRPDPTTPGKPVEPVTSPLREIANRLYLRAGHRITGQLPDEASTDVSPPVDAERWGAVVVGRESP